MKLINFSCSIFSAKNVLTPPYQNLSIPPDQNVTILFLNNVYIGNIITVWHRRADIVQNLCEFCRIFWSNFLGPKCPNIPILYTTLADNLAEGTYKLSTNMNMIIKIGNVWN